MTTALHSTCDEYEPLLAAYALGEHDPEIAQQLEAHLADCQCCRESLAAYRAVAQYLPLSVPTTAPAPDLRDRVVGRVAAAAQGQDSPAPAPAKPQRWWRWERVALAFNAALLVAMLFWNLSLMRPPQALNEHEETRIDWAKVAQVFNTPGIQSFTLTSDNSSAPIANGTLWFAPEQREGCLVVQDMPQLPPEQVYQLWLLQGAQRTSGGTFYIDPEGNGWLLISLATPLSSFERVGVTIEPDGGSPGPTTPRLLGGDL
ncbi:MAG: anti-sigma factor [Chloroflexales bacterium]|nr:anti-sigma factor [Chloroflexales bacterium]